MTYDKFNGINLDDYNLVPDLNKCPEFGVFADELKPIINEVMKLPYGCLAILVYAMQDILRGQEFDVPQYLHPYMMSAYFMMMGALLTNEKIDLTITKEDINNMNRLVKKIIGLLSLIQMYYKKEIEVVLKGGRWYVKDGELLIEEAEKNVEKFFSYP